MAQGIEIADVAISEIATSLFLFFVRRLACGLVIVGGGCVRFKARGLRL